MVSFEILGAIRMMPFGNMQINLHNGVDFRDHVQ